MLLQLRVYGADVLVPIVCEFAWNVTAVIVEVVEDALAESDTTSP